ncbi:MAG: IgGFc-binding protein [Bacteroidetes bacterium]|nr:IgGFc-binding protein [Bacteroidota bacterium]MCL2302448.1 IgGFc-binding protein [Lentimicrobiaceae bacterium]
MRIIQYFLTAAVFLMPSIFSVQAQETGGKEFWITFGENMLSPASAVDLQIRIVSGNKAVTGNIHFADLGISVPFSIGAQQVHTYSLDPAQRQAVYNQTMGISNKSIYISTSDTVTVYAMNQRLASADATNVLPRRALGTEYYQITYGTGEYAVIAIADDTKLFHNGTPILGQESLNAGQVYYRTFTTTGDYITSNKPVAFFSFNRMTTIPNAIGSPEHLMQQLVPVNRWGKTFFVPVSHLNVDIVRIVASQNNTTITQTGGIIRPEGQQSLVNLQAGQFVELEVPIGNNGCFIISNKPVGVCAYLVGNNYNGLGLSDPAQSWVAPAEHAVKKAQIAPFIPSGTTHIGAHYALLWTPHIHTGDVRVSIGGAPPVPVPGPWIQHSSGLSFCTMQLTNPNASYLFTQPLTLGFHISCYGVGFAESYYYLAYSAMYDLSDAVFFANEIHHLNLYDTLICESVVNFRAEIQEQGPLPNISGLKWYIDGVEEFSAQNQQTWSKTFSPGEYEIRMRAHYENGDTISKTGILRICNVEVDFYVNEIHYQDLNNTIFCESEVEFRAEIEGLHTDAGSLQWYINETEELAARDQKTWSKTFINGKYDIEMRVRFANNETESLPGAFTIYAGGFIKMRNIRH